MAFKVGDHPIGGEMKAGMWVLQVRCFVRKRSQKGNPMLEAHIEGVSKQVRGGVTFDYFVLNDDAIWKLGNLAQAVGIPDDVVLDETSDSDMRKLLGRPFVGILVGEEYQGETRAKLKRMRAYRDSREMIAAPDAQGYTPQHENQGKILYESGSSGGGWSNGSNPGSTWGGSSGGASGGGWGDDPHPASAGPQPVPDIDYDNREEIPRKPDPVETMPGGWPQQGGDDEDIPF